MRECSKDGEAKTSAHYEDLEALVREKVKGFIHDILEEEVTEFLGRGKSERRGERVDAPEGYRNGYGRPRKLSLMHGTVNLRRPRVRNEDGFESRVLPLFQRKSREVETLLPELYLHGLAQKDFELALRGLEYEAWKTQDLSSLKLVYQWADTKRIF